MTDGHIVTNAFACRYGWVTDAWHWGVMRSAYARQLARQQIQLKVDTLPDNPDTSDWERALFLPKMRAWAAACLAATGPLLLTDLDMLLYGNTELLATPGKITLVRTRPGSINTGQIIHHQDAGKAWIKAMTILESPPADTRWNELIKKHHTNDQAVWAWILEHEPEKTLLTVVEEGQLNLCTLLHEWNRRACFIHVKSGLRVLVWDLNKERYTADTLSKIPTRLVEWCKLQYAPYITDKAKKIKFDRMAKKGR